MSVNHPNIHLISVIMKYFTSSLTEYYLLAHCKVCVLILSGEISLFVVRTIQNTKIYYVGIEGCILMLLQMAHIVTTGF